MDIVMTTYFPSDELGEKRYQVCQRTVLALTKLVGAEYFELHIADDGSELAVDLTPCTNSERRGIGASLNLALAHEQRTSDTWMYTPDDWLLLEELDLDKALELIKRGYDVVRIGPTHPNLTCQTMFDGFWWLDIDVKSQGLAFATRPFVASYDFYDRIGPFDEGLNVYDTEVRYAQRVAEKGAKIAQLVDLHGPWEHLGEDLQVGHLR